MITETRKGISALGALTLFTALSAEVWPRLLGAPGAIILWAALSALIAVAVTRLGGWAKLHPGLLPKSLALVAVLAVLSIAWAPERAPAAGGIAGLLAVTLAGIFLATTFSWPALLALLGRSSRLLIGLALIFELVRALFLPPGIQPVACLGTVAALGLVVLIVQCLSGTVGLGRMLCWVAVFTGALIVAGSWTAVAALAATGLAWGALRLARSRAEGHRGWVAIASAGVAVLAGTTLAMTSGHWPALPEGLASMSAAGLVLVLAVIVSTLYRAWWLGADRQHDSTGIPLPFATASLVPLLLAAFALVYLTADLSSGATANLAASWLILTTVTVKSKQDAHSVALALDAVSGRSGDKELPGFPR